MLTHLLQLYPVSILNHFGRGEGARTLDLSIMSRLLSPTELHPNKLSIRLTSSYRLTILLFKLHFNFYYLWRVLRESNPHSRFRRPLSYPLNEGRIVKSGFTSICLPRLSKQGLDLNQQTLFYI